MAQKWQWIVKAAAHCQGSAPAVRVYKVPGIAVRVNAIKVGAADAGRADQEVRERSHVRQRKANDGTTIDRCEAIAVTIGMSGEADFRTHKLRKVICAAAYSAKINGVVLHSVDRAMGSQVGKTREDIHLRWVDTCHWLGCGAWCRRARGCGAGGCRAGS